MLAAEDYENVVWDNNETAFISLEEKARRKLAMLEDNHGSNTTTDLARYMNFVMALAKQLGVEQFDRWQPMTAGVDAHSLFPEFMSDVDAVTLHAYVRRARGEDYTVALEGPTKTKIHHQIERIRVLIDKEELAPEKKDRLLARLNAFAAEVDKQRTGLQVFGALFAGVGDAFGQFVERSKMLDVMDTIGRMIGHDMTREEDRRPRLPAPKPPKRIEGPPKPEKRGGWDKPKQADLDDDIPF